MLVDPAPPNFFVFVTAGGGPGVPCDGSLDLVGIDISCFAPLELFMQAFFIDPDAKFGVSMSNGLHEVAN